MKGTPETRKNVVTSIFLEPDELEEHQRQMELKYARAHQEEQRSESYLVEDAEILLVGYGIVSRVLRSAVDKLRQQGIRAGLFRPITLWPFPSKALAQASAHVSQVLVVELSNGQLVEDVRLNIRNGAPVEFYGRAGGNVPSVEEIESRVVARAVSV